MHCKGIHRNLISFLDEELSAEEMKAVRQHLERCPKCALFAEELKRTWHVLDRDKILKPSPYFYTRVKARLGKTNEQRARRSVRLVRVLPSAVFLLLLFLGIYGGAQLGAHFAETQTEVKSQQTILPYWNEMEIEPLENFLMQ